MNCIRPLILPLMLILFLGLTSASVKGDREIVVFVECRGNQSVFNTSELVLKNRSYFDERGITVTFSRAKGCGYLLVNKMDMVKLDASLDEKELLDRCDKFFFPKAGTK